MPIHKVGYREWTGEKTPQWNRWWIITETGFRTAFKSAWVRRILLVCWIPVLYWGIGLFVLERVLSTNIIGQQKSESAIVDEVEDEMQRRAADRVLKELDDFDMLPEREALLSAITSNDENEVRHTIWSWLLMTYFRYPQGTAILFLLGFIAPGLVSQDVRSRAFLLYFSRPIGRIEYILGKIFVPIVFVSLITLVPAIFLFMFGVTLSPDLSVLKATWDIPFRIVLASLVVIVPTCSIALMLSSVTQESRFATFAWFALWALGHAAWMAIVITQFIRMENQYDDLQPFGEEVMANSIVNDWSVVSLYNNLANVQSWIFGFQPFSEVWASFAVLVVITVVSLCILYRGVSAPINV